MGGDVVNTVYGPISAEFAKSPLDVLCVPDSGVQTGPFGSQLHASDYIEYGTPIITVEHLGENRIIHNNLPRITDEDKNRLARYTLITGDIVFSRVGSVDRRAIVHPEEDGWLFSGRCLRVRPDRKKIDPGFLSWFFGLPTFQELIRQIAVGATMPSINTKILGDVPIYYPPSLTEQQAIACILGSLDDKIELNRKMNRTLEAMAQAIFKSWFVDFDPVRAKTEGRDPGLPKKIADLFPDSFENSELGEIPKGWKTVSLYETARFINGAAFKSEDFCAPSKGLPVVKIAELKEGISSQTQWSQRQADPNQFIDTGDLLYSWSGSPDTSLEAFLWTKGRGLLNQHIFKVVTPTVAHKRFVYYLLKHLRSVLVEIARNKQTTGLGHVTVADMKRLLVCLPTKAVLAAFDRKTAPFFDKALATIIENQTLAALRDTLLPQLISGELRVPDAERIVRRYA